MKRWQLSLGLATTALAAALIAPRLVPLLVESAPHTPVASPAPPVDAPTVEPVATVADEPRTIDLVLALDTSGSMESLIDSARVRLWDIVNQIDAQDPEAELRVGLIAYGTPAYGAENGFVKVVMPLTDDLDALYSAAWALQIDGGDEYVGAVIQHALVDMDWAERDDRNKRLLFIAGNETAALGPVPYRQAASMAVANGMQVSTLFAGNDANGRHLEWQSVAQAGNGRYVAIDARISAVALRSPWDDDLEQLNTELNGSYVAGDRKARARLATILDNDANASSMGGLAGRVASKSTAKFKTDWDLVDQAASGKLDAKAVDTSALPGDLANLDPAELEEELKDRASKRASTKSQIQELQKKRSQWIAEQSEAQAGEGMDEAMNQVLADLL